MKPKILVVLGPTATGKSDLGIKLARKFNGEIISADSRQVYKGMDIGTGKVTKREQKQVEHHLLNVAKPSRQFTVADYKKLAATAIKKIIKQKKLPIIVGGTAFYIYSLVDGWSLPEVPPNLKLRKSLQKKSAAELFAMLIKLDTKRAQNIDEKNPARLIRAVEIAQALGQVPEFKKSESAYDVLFLGIKKNDDVLRQLINTRVDKRLKTGMVAEIKKLHRAGLSYKRLESFGLEYRFIALYLQNKLEYKDMILKLKTAIYQFSKRQMTWFKNDERIHWIKNEKQAVGLAKKFL